ncbi:hypothetical protein D9619_004180 [Psilocybe cf. subviscida]|uniref:Uncharacterized protein n=1 Tax=Psilocybe cf. subviscida TaxID=2480587 RepID=A0A8H5BR75_9AGAR|nr:hypothetical protein D9619_004180 [Psilocybe cf. subviscida]
MPSNEELYDYGDLIDDEYSESDDDEIRSCTKCPAHLSTVIARLKAPNLLARQDIPCLIFGEDALDLVFTAHRHRRRKQRLLCRHHHLFPFPPYKRSLLPLLRILFMVLMK